MPKITLRMGANPSSGRGEDTPTGRPSRSQMFESGGTRLDRQDSGSAAVASPGPTGPGSSHGSDSQAAGTPGLDNQPYTNGHTNGSMLPPTMHGYSGSPAPYSAPSGLPREPSANSFESKWRRPGKSKFTLISYLS
jgi:hypothetical protein